MRVLVMVPINEEDEQQSSAPQIAIVCFQNESESMLTKRGKGDSRKVVCDPHLAIYYFLTGPQAGNKWSVVVGQLRLALMVVALAGVWQYWPQDTTTSTSKQPGSTEHLQLSHEPCGRQPIRPSTITVIETTTATTTAMETTTATETNIVTSTATETTWIEMAPASPDCVCTISTVLGDPVKG